MSSIIDEDRNLEECKIPVIVHRNYLVGVGHHSYQHVEKNNDVATRIDAKHEQGPKSCELLDS